MSYKYDRLIQKIRQDDSFIYTGIVFTSSANLRSCFVNPLLGFATGLLFCTILNASSNPILYLRIK